MSSRRTKARWMKCATASLPISSAKSPSHWREVGQKNWQSAPNPANFETQKKQLTEEVLQSKRSLAFEAFRTALENRLKQEGKLKLMPEKLKTFGSLG